MTPIWIIGNGGHAAVAIDALKAQSHHTVAGIASDDSTSTPIESGVPHIGPVTPEIMRQHDAHHAFIAVGSNDTRARIAAALREHVEWVSIIHPSAVVSPSATIGPGVLLGAGCVVQPFATIGHHVIVNTAASVDHDCHIGAFAHIGPGARLAGDVSVGEMTLVGIGASVIPGITIGREVVIGAGSVVISDVPDSTKMVGNPARPIR